jgi:hypothetical protein
VRLMQANVLSLPNNSKSCPDDPDVKAYREGLFRKYSAYVCHRTEGGMSRR